MYLSAPFSSEQRSPRQLRGEDAAAAKCGDGGARGGGEKKPSAQNQTALFFKHRREKKRRGANAGNGSGGEFKFFYRTERRGIRGGKKRASDRCGETDVSRLASFYYG